MSQTPISTPAPALPLAGGGQGGQSWLAWSGSQQHQGTSGSVAGQIRPDDDEPFARYSGCTGVTGEYSGDLTSFS